MNTINQIRPYTMTRTNQNLKTMPNFKGVVGEKVLEDLSKNKIVTVAGILTMLGGFLGLSKEKVSDVIEALLNKIKNLQTDKEALT